MTTPTRDDDHWLVRRTTIRRLWTGGLLALAATVAAQLFIPVKGYFGIDGWFAFAAVFGFVACLAMIVAAKVLGVVLKRPDTYYDA